MQISPKQARLLSEKTQVETAKHLKVAKQTYLKWEGSPDEMPVGKAKEFSKFVGRSVDEIFFDSQSTLSRLSEMRQSI